MLAPLLYIVLLFSANIKTTEVAEVQKLTYTILQNDKEIGQVDASKTTFENQITYTSYSNSTAHAIININIVSAYEVYLENNEIRSAEANVTVRGRPYAHSYTQYCSGQCEIVKDGFEVIYIDEAISYASTMLLFEEPINVQYSYSELDGSFHEIKKIEEQVYEKTDVKGKVNRYRYANGILQYAKIDAGLISFEMRLN